MDARSIKLKHSQMPLVGFGTYLISNQDAETIILKAIEAGYRHIDTAQGYFNEEGIDVVVNNAGIGAIGIQEFFSVADMHKIFDVNVYGVQRIMRAAIPYLKKQNQSTVVHISSGIGRLTFPFYSTYCASKYALEALAEGYRAELAGFGIETCIIEPGAMPTEFLDTMVKLQPRDESRVHSYGEMVSIPEMAMKSL